MAMQTKLELPKREDEINERTLLAGIGYERQVRFEKVQDLTCWVKKGYNFFEIGKCKEDQEKTDTYDNGVYACALYICKKILPFEIVWHVPKVESKLIKQRFEANYKMIMDDFVPSDAIHKMSLSIRCPIDKTRIKVAVKGPYCKHAQAFDLDAYV